MPSFLNMFSCTRIKETCAPVKTSCINKFDQNNDQKLDSQDFKLFIGKMRAHGEDFHAKTEAVLQKLNTNLQLILNALLLVKQYNLVNPKIVTVLDAFIAAIVEFNKLYSSYSGIKLKISAIELPKDVDGMTKALAAAREAVDHAEDLAQLLPNFNFIDKLPLGTDDFEKLKLILDKVQPATGLVDGLIDLFKPGAHVTPSATIDTIVMAGEEYFDVSEDEEEKTHQPVVLKRPDTPMPSPTNTLTKKEERKARKEEKREERANRVSFG